MAQEQAGAQVNLQFVVPEEQVLSTARALSHSPDQSVRDVAKCLLDTTAVTVRTRNELAAAAARVGNCDLAPYFDHWMGDAPESARHLLHHSPDPAVRTVARYLIAQSDAISGSKERFLELVKRAERPQ